MAGKRRQPDWQERYDRGLALVADGSTWAAASEAVGWNKNKLRHDYRMQTDGEYRGRMRSLARSANATRMEKLRTILVEAKSRPCVDCGRSYPWPVMELDHVRGTKTRTIGNGSGFSTTTLRAEIAKCELRCPTCHRLRHYAEGI